MRKFIVFHEDITKGIKTLEQYKRISLIGLLCELEIDIGWLEEDTLAERLTDHEFHKDTAVENIAIDYVNGPKGYNTTDDHYLMIGEMLPGNTFKLLIGRKQR